MTKDEFALWQTITGNSCFHWTEDAIFRLNGRGAFYYIGGEDGGYMRIHKDGSLEVGAYEGAIPHIGEAVFIPAWRQTVPVGYVRRYHRGTSEIPTRRKGLGAGADQGGNGYSPPEKGSRGENP